MGQAYSLTTLSAGSAGIDVPELSDLTYEKNLGDARFMKAVRARHNNGLVVVKIVMKPFASMKLGNYVQEIQRERKQLFDIPNALGYHQALETSSNGYLVRQYIYSSLYDRMSTRPFLEDIEKRWLAYQLLSAVRDCHTKSLYHGDIKTENLLVTSWNWLYLSDFSSSYKPTYLPEDNPAEFSFFFDTAGRRTCYLAPERFLSADETATDQGGLTWAMDIFSVGCVIAEIFLETPIFNLSQLFKYRTGEYSPDAAYLNRIEDEDIRELIQHMIQIEPESRFSAEEYLNFWRRKAFPEYFYSFLHQYMHMITDPAPDRSATNSLKTENNGESDDRIDRIFTDFDKIAYFLGYDDPDASIQKQELPTSVGAMFPLYLDVPNRRQIVAPIAVTKDDGTLLFLGVVTSALRSVARATTKVRACELLLTLSQRLTDESKLDRVLPYLMVLVQDPSDLVKVAALRSLAQLLAMVSITSPINAYLFPEYIMPRLEFFSPPANRKLNPLVRATYASCLAALAHSASRYLDITQVLKSEGAVTSRNAGLENGAASLAYHDLYDAARLDLIKFFEKQTKALLTDSHADVRRAFLESVSSLCVFFGSARANDVILSHLNTYLNDRDWRLKCSFFETIVGVAVYVGSTNLEEFILPLMVQALNDSEDSVVEDVIRSLATMQKLGLLQRSKTWELVDLVARFTVHPNSWIREAAAHFVTASATYLTVADCECIMKPLLQPYLRKPLSSFAEADLLDGLKTPFSRSLLDMATSWALKAETGSFWKSSPTRSFTTLGDDRLRLEPSIKAVANTLSKTYKSEEDVQWLSRLRNVGMSGEDEIKLLALREYIWRSSKQKGKSMTNEVIDRFSRIVSLTTLGVNIETVFFDQHERYIANALPGRAESEQPKASQTISDALLDASTMVSDDSRPATGVDITSKPRAIPQRLKSPTSGEHGPRVRSPLATSQGVAHDTTDSSPTQHKPSLKPMPASLETSRSSTSSSLERPSQLQDDRLHRKGSAISLLQKRATSTKAEAAISTSSENAHGHNDGHFSSHEPTSSTPYNDVGEKKSVDTTQPQFEGAHDYRGRDPNVLKLLDSVYLDKYPMDNIDFGPLVTPIQQRNPDTNSSAAPGRTWKPSGSLVAVFGEHTEAVNRVLPSPDHIFFLTASDDGDVRVWDCARLEQNLAHRSKQVYKHGSNDKVTALCFVENTHCFVSAGSDGSVHVVKVETTETTQGTIKYVKPRVLRRWQMPEPDAYVVWMEHFREESQSVLIMATTASTVIALDLRSMEVLYTLRNPRQHGIPTCFCVDRQRLWLLLGTSTGCLDLWDLRFHVPLKQWSMSGGTAIHRLFTHPAPPERLAEGREQGPKKRQKLVCIVGGTGAGEVTIWDLETKSCTGVYRTVTTSNADGLGSRSYVLADLDSTSSSSTLSQAEQTLASDPMNRNASKPDNNIRALSVGTLSSTSNGSPAEPYLITGGPDLSIRFWNMNHIQQSCVINGSDTPDTKQSGSVSRTVFRRADKTALLPIFEEQIFDPSQEASQESSSRSAESRRSRANVGAKRSVTSSVVGSSQTDTQKSEAELPPKQEKKRHTMISDQQQRLLRSHLDTILDVAVLEYPKRMVVSVDRSGVVYVFS